INKKEAHNTFTCVARFEDQIDSSSITINDISHTNKFCYGLQKDNSLFTFSCPKENFTADEITIKKVLLEQFKNIEDIRFAKIILWTDLEKNKRSVLYP
ncbi:MAG: hypothetical protein V4591_01450, partial [Bdellovibrionota bacterium]